MNPQFIDIEFADPGTALIPTALAWSLADGRIKHVVIMPEEDWLPGDPDEEGLDRTYYSEQGVPAIEALEELLMDVEVDCLYTDGVDPDELLLDRLFTSFRRTMPFELAPVSTLLGTEPAATEEERQALAREAGLEPESAEAGVLSLLLLAREYRLL